MRSEGSFCGARGSCQGSPYSPVYVPKLQLVGGAWVNQPPKMINIFCQAILIHIHVFTCLRFALWNLSNSLQFNELWIKLARNFGLMDFGDTLIKNHNILTDCAKLKQRRHNKSLQLTPQVQLETVAYVPRTVSIWPRAAGQLNSMLGSIKFGGLRRSYLAKVGDVQCRIL